MQKIFLIPLALLALILSPRLAASQESKTTEDLKMSESASQDLAGIRKALDSYVDAAIKGDSKVAMPAFAPKATMSWAENGKLVTVPISELYAYFDKTGPHPASYEITSARVAGDVAIVSIESKFGDTSFDDMFTLVKDGDAWKIVSKVYHVK